MNTNYPLKGIADGLAARGRRGDTMLLHVSPEEVAGLASLVPLTINPDTGQPEAFNFLKSLAPIIGSVVGTALFPALPAFAAGAIGSGLATTAVTGDLERGLISGVVGAGLGAALGSAGSAAEAIAPATTEGAVGDALTSTIAPGMQNIPEVAFGSFNTGIGPDLGAAAITNPSTFTERLTAPFQAGSGLFGELKAPRTLLPLALGMGQLSEMDTREAWNKGAKDLAGNRQEKLDMAYNDLQAGYRAAQPNAISGPNPWRNRFTGYAHGGQVNRRGDRDMMRYGGDSGYSPDSGYKTDLGYGGIDPITIQQGLRGLYNVSAYTPQGFMPGFDPEFNYFQNDTANIQLPPVANYPRTAGYNPMLNRFLQQDKLPTTIPKQPIDKGYADGGEVTLKTPSGSAEVPAGGIAGIQNQYTSPPVPSGQEVQQLAQAILSGESPVIEKFIGVYGVDMFRQIREIILRSVAPNAQIEGMIQGPGGPRDDQIPGTVGNGESIAVSPGEYIVPADVVQGLGGGSSHDGANELDGMMENVRKERKLG